MQQHRASPPSLVSPKKKARQHVVTRQIFALPALQQFEPVLASSPRSYMVPTGSIPKIGKMSSSNNNATPNSSSSRPNSRSSDSEAAAVRPASPAVASLSSAVLQPHHQPAPHRPPREREESPRALRPQPPPPLGISARADVDIYRYNQGTTQRMVIRPIFEQRKEDEAQVAREILSQRENSDGEGDAQRMDVGGEAKSQAVREQELQGNNAEPEQLHANGGSARQSPHGHKDPIFPVSVPADAGEEVQEFTSIKFVSPRSADRANRPRSGFDGARGGEQALRPTKLKDSGDIQTQHPATSSEAGKPTASELEHEKNRSRGEPGDGTSLSALGEAKTSDDTAATVAAEFQLVRPLLPSHYYEPFRSIDSGINRSFPWPQDKVTPASLPGTAAGSTSRPPSAREQRPQPIDVLYKVLWKDLHVFDGRDVMLSLLLSSEATVHITIADPPNHRLTNDGEILLITELHLAMSSQLRRDLRVLTPKWAEWVLSRVRLDSHGRFYLQLDDSFTVESSSCFDEELCIDDFNLRVAMHVLDDSTSLLISVRDLESGETSKIFLSKSEILKLAASFGIAPSASAEEAEEEESAAVAKLLQNAVFLTQIATKSLVICLGMRSKEDSGDSFSLHDLQSSEYTADFPAGHEAHSDGASPVINLPSLRCAFYSAEVSSILLSNSSLAAVAFLSQMYAEDGLISALRHLQQREAVQLHAQSYVTHHQSVTSSGNEHFRALIAAKVEAAKQSKLQEIAILSIIDDMLADLITFESRMELYEAKYSGGYDDHYASKVQATFRMSTQRKMYAHKKHTRMRAARLLQALQRGIIARKRYCEMKIEREKYLFYGFRSSLHHAAAAMENPKQRAQEMAGETERRRQSFLMQVLDGYIAEHGIAAPHRVSAELVESLFNEFGVVVGLSTTFGGVVAFFLGGAPDAQGTRRISSAKVGNNGPPREPPRLYSTGQVNAALLLGLQSQYDDTFGLTPTTRRLVAAADPLSTGQSESAENDEVPPRWLLKINAPFQRSNRNRLAALRLSRKAAGRKSAHLVARDFRNLLTATESLAKFERCREFWESNIRARRAELRIYDASSKDDVVQFVLDLLISSIKDWGVDPEPLFAGLNVCARHRQGKEVVGLVETKFNIFAEGVNQMHGKRNILSLREEIEQELEDFEKLLALRCLNIGQDHVVTIPPSEILHIILKGKVDDEYVRHALPTVLPIASIADKYELAQKMVLAYANACYGDALNAICWSCLDVSENVTVEAAQFLDRITRVDEQLGGGEGELRDDPWPPRSAQRTKRVQAPAPPPPTSSIASRALYLLTGAQAVTFLQFVAKVAHFNKTIQHRTLALLRPYAETFELHRLASTVAGLDSYDVTARLFDVCFAPLAVYPSTRFWIQYEELFGLEQAEKARESRPGGIGNLENGDTP